MKIHLAPMEGVVDHHLRRILTELGGIDVCTTEFIRVTDHCLPDRVFYRYCPELMHSGTTPAQIPVKVQLLGNNPEAMAANASRAVELGATAIDMNFGCPAKTVNNSYGGARLLDEPNLIEHIVAKVRRQVPVAVPVSAKIRLGFETRDQYLVAAQAVVNGGANELIVHARSRADGYKPPAYWHVIAQIKSHFAIPVVANGEIWSVADWHECRHQSLCDQVMLGRGLLAQPGLALQIKADWQGHPIAEMDWQAACKLLYHYHLQTYTHYPIKHMGNRVKQWLSYLRRQYPQAQHFMEAIKRSRDAELINKQFESELERVA